jgi:DNA-binding response OmpR family regulator
MTIPRRTPPFVLMIHRPQGAEGYGGYLSEAGFRVAEAHDGQEGFAQALALGPDFIVLDFDLNGELVARLKGHQATKQIPVIALADLARLRHSQPDRHHG